MDSMSEFVTPPMIMYPISKILTASLMQMGFFGTTKVIIVPAP